MKPLPCRRRGSTLLCASWFCAFWVVSSLLLISSVTSAQVTSKANRASAESLTQFLMVLHAQYQTAPPAGKAALLLQVRTVAARRQQLLSSLVQTSPGEVLRVAIPGSIAATLPASVQSFVEQETDAQGELEVMYEDSDTGAKLHHFLMAGSQRLELKFAADAPTNLLTGSIVHVHGTRIGSALALSSGTSTGSFQVVQAAPLSNTFGAQNTLVMLVNFQDNPITPWTTSLASDVEFNQVSSFYMENSDQQTWVTGDVAGWYTIAVQSTNCDASSIASDAKAAAQAAGFNLSNYTHYVYNFPVNSGCAWSGLAEVGGSNIWINGQIGARVAAHELGHNFGLYHSHDLECGTVSICGNGTIAEYGDTLDTMGGYRNGHFDAFQKERLGWLSNGAQPPITTVTSSGTYTIGPYEAQDSNAKALKILQSSSSGAYYYVEFRQPLGFDSFVLGYPNYLNGVVVHLASPSDANSSKALDMTPTSPISFTDAGLGVGKSFYDSSAGLTITPVSTNSSGASVQVTLGTQSCAHANPSLSMSPAQSAWVLSGTTVSFTATLTNNDSSACSNSSFNLSAGVPSGWSSSLGSSVLTVAPGASGSTTLQVTSATGTPDGFYNITTNATNAAAPSYAASASATNVISTPAPMSMSVSTDKTSYSASQTVTVTVTVFSGSSPKAGASVSVSITPPKGGAASLTGITNSNGVAAVTYTLKKRAMTGTYQVQASTTAVGAAPSTTASTTFTLQ
ncbi:MAG TPA: NEW3 domain-containing protein [Terriglobales bacterium]|nr:NEW3 domain-containing protein [Terriglobales bacterium]